MERLRRRVLVDTSAWYGLAASDDTHHAEAVRVLRHLSDERSTLFTTNHIVAEAYTLLRGRLGTRAALTFLERLRASTTVQRIFVISEWEEAAEELLGHYSDQDFSYVDAVSFVAMGRLGVDAAFAFDHHFEVAGFTLLPDRN